MTLVLVASVARGGAIGRGGGLLWRDPADMRHFVRTTTGTPVIMGRRTWDSLPERFRPLPARRNLVVSRNAALAAPGAEVVPSLDAALRATRDAPRVHVIGGAELYAQALPLADELVLTEVDAEFADADAFFPAWERNDFDEVARVPQVGSDGMRFAFVTYRRRHAASG